MIVVLILIAASVASAAFCYFQALLKGLDPVRWVVLGALLGPIAVALVLMAEPKRGDDG